MFVLIVSALIFLSQILILNLSLEIFDLSELTKEFYIQYFKIRIYSAPGELTLYILTGLFVGLQKTKISSLIIGFFSILNIFLSIVLVTKFDLNTNTKVDKKFIEAPDNPYIDGDYVWVTSLDFQPNDFGKCEFDISCSLPFSVYKLDKNNLETINKYSFSKSVFGLPTVAVPFNNEIYLGSFHSDRIGIVKTN